MSFHLPRWTVYPALALLFGGIFAFLPGKEREPFERAGGVPEGGSLAPMPGAAPGAPEVFPRVVVLGIDGMDPELLAQAIERFPEHMPNFKALAEANGIHQLGTSTPPQSPVAWSNFITGQDPGGHGIFDFLHRDLVTRGPIPSTSKSIHGWNLPLGGDFVVPIGGSEQSNRSGVSFWALLRAKHVPADIWRMPANFPVEASEGLSFSGMMTPAIDSAYGECTLYTTDATKQLEISYKKLTTVQEFGGLIETKLLGPASPFSASGERASVPLKFYIDKEANAAAIDTGTQVFVLEPGQWSDFAKVTFSPAPAGLADMGGIVRFYLRSLQPFELYASPVNIDPTDPVAPVSEPIEASAELAERIGLFYTQGMAEDVGALKKKLIDEREFAQQVEHVYLESQTMLDYAIDHYLERGTGGLLFFYFSTVDLTSHMLWRLSDPKHPNFDAKLAAEDSSWFTGRPGSTWRDAPLDLLVKMDSALGKLRERLGPQTTILVMSDHGFAPYNREFSLNTWLYDNGYLVLKSGQGKEQPESEAGHQEVYLYGGAVDWSKTRAYGVGFQGLYLNLAGRELDNPKTEDEDESGIVQPGAEADALLAELQQKLTALRDPKDGVQVLLRADRALDVYHGSRVAEAPDLILGYNSGYDNSDAASIGRITNAVLQDNLGGTFNGSHLMAPEVVSGALLSNRKVRAGQHRLEDLTIEVLRQFGVAPGPDMHGSPVLE